MNLFNPKKYVKLQLWGLDGNAFSLMGAFRSQARKVNGDERLVLAKWTNLGFIKSPSTEL